MGALQLVERSYDRFDVGEIGEELVRGVLKNFFIRVETSGADCDGPSTEMARAVDVVWRVADDDELFWRESELQMFSNALGGERGKIASIMRLVTKRAWQSEKLVEPNQFHLQISHRFDVAGQER